MKTQLTFADAERAARTRKVIAYEVRELLAEFDAAPKPEVSLLEIRSPDDAAKLLEASMRDLEQEEMHVLLLSTKNHVLRDVCVYKGSTNGVPLRVAEIFRDAVRDGAMAVILAHNHPSGDPTPSPEDVRVTREVVAAGQLLDIQVLDHVIVGRDRFVSLKEKRLGF
jgi:DNA repair protein RadC